MGEAQHRVLRRRSRAGDDRRAVGGGRVCLLADGLAGGERPLPAGGDPEHRRLREHRPQGGDAARARFAQAAGCGDATNTAECLRSKSPAQIIDAQIAAGLAWRPVQGGEEQPALAPAAFATGEFNRMPEIGNTRHEVRAFVYEGNDLTRQPVTAPIFEAQVRRQQGANADRVLEAYPLTSAPGAVLAAVGTDSGSPATPLQPSLTSRNGRRPSPTSSGMRHRRRAPR